MEKSHPDAMKLSLRAPGWGFFLCHVTRTTTIHNEGGFVMNERLSTVRNVSEDAKRPFDAIVIGGGSNGTAVARDAAMRGLRVALLEKDDFGYGTVSRSTRLIHGGLRYLELFEFGLVRESLREREVLLRTAPHLVRPLKFFTPVYTHSPVSVFKLRLGMWLYDMLSWDKTVPRHTLLSPNSAIVKEPLLNDKELLGVFVYFDGHVPMPERLCLEGAQQAASRGALVLNHARAVTMRREGDQYTVGVRDELTGGSFELRSRSVINATGPWADAVNEALLGSGVEQSDSSPKPSDRLRRTKGIHMLVPKLSEHAIVMLAESDGRLFFAIPWGEYTYIGTTDTDFEGDLDTIRAKPDEIRYLMEETQRVFPEADLQAAHFTTAGVRPLVKDPNARTEGQVSRKHLVHHHLKEGLPGFFSVLGGKITNMRSVAEETVDAVVRHLDVDVAACTTRQALFPGALHPNMDELKAELIHRYETAGIKIDTVNNAVDLYGSNATRVLQLVEEDPSLAERVHPEGPDIWAQLTYGLRHEWVYTTADFLIRRTAIGLGPGMALDIAPEVARRIGAAFERTEEQVDADLAAYVRTTELMSGTPDEQTAPAHAVAGTRGE